MGDWRSSPREICVKTQMMGHSNKTWYIWAMPRTLFFCDLDLQSQGHWWPLKVRFWPFFHFLAQFSYTESQIILWLVYIIHIYVLCKHAEI